MFSYSGVTVNDIGQFLLFLFNSKTYTGTDYSGNALNTYRSALSFFLKLDLPDLGYHPIITRLFSFFYKKRPSFPKYVVTWDVGIVLRFLAGWHPASSLSLRQLTLKTVALMALTCCDRAQTLHALRSNQVSTTPRGDVEFVIYDILKTSRRGRPARVVKCVKYHKPELDVADYVLKYMVRVWVFRRRAVKYGRPMSHQLFLSHKTGTPVAKATISRWIKEVMAMAGIDTSMFSPGSTRGASVSAAARKGASIEQILGAGDWTNTGTFEQYYRRHVNSTPVGRLILDGASDLV